MLVPSNVEQRMAYRKSDNSPHQNQLYEGQSTPEFGDKAG
jgi:hypothetical protein